MTYPAHCQFQSNHEENNVITLWNEPLAYGSRENKLTQGSRQLAVLTFVTMRCIRKTTCFCHNVIRLPLVLLLVQYDPSLDFF